MNCHGLGGLNTNVKFGANTPLNGNNSDNWKSGVVTNLIVVRKREKLKLEKQVSSMFANGYLNQVDH